MPFYPGHTHSIETRRKLSEAGKGRTPWNKGKKMSGEQRAKLSLIHTGKTLSDEHKKKIADALSGDKSNTWKGDNVSYSGIHKWINKVLGRPTVCSECGKSDLSGHQIHWANIDHKYSRNPADWIRLCTVCHTKYDKEHFNGNS